MSTYNARWQAIYSISRNLFLYSSCSLTSLHTRKKDNPGKEAYKLAREQIGTVEVNDKAHSSHENEGRSWLCVTNSHDMSHKKDKYRIKEGPYICPY